MADYTTSAYLAAQEIIQDGYSAHEQRERMYPILGKGLDNPDFMYANIADIKESSKRDVKLYQFKRDTSTGSTARTHNPSGTQGDTLEITPIWNIYAEEFALYMNAGKDNKFSNGQMLANRIKEKMRIIRQRLGSALLTSLHTNRTGLADPNVLNATFDTNTDTYQISDPDMFYAYLQSVMFQHDYAGNLDVLIGAGLAPITKKQANQGDGNSTNFQWQLDGMDIMQHADLGTSIATDYSKVALALPEYSFGYIPFVPKDFREGFGDFDNYNGGKTIIEDSIFGNKLTYTLYGRTDAVDGSSNGGTTNDYKTTWQISAEVAVQQAELSEADEELVYAFGLTG